MASPGKPLFTIILIIKWLQIGGLPSDLHESPRGLKQGIRDCKRRAAVKPVQEECPLAAYACRRARFDGTLQAPGEARKRSQRNGSPQQQRGEQRQRGKQRQQGKQRQRGKQQCIARPASNQLPRASCAQQVPMCAGGPCRDCWSSFSPHPAQHRNCHPSGGSCT